MRKRRFFGAFLSFCIVLLYSTATLGSAEGDAINIVKTYHAKVSWYNYGKKTANGEKFFPNKLTVAHKTLPFGTRVRITNTQNKKSVIVRVNDRGPYIKGREFDLTIGAARKLDIIKVGVALLKIEIIK